MGGTAASQSQNQQAQLPKVITLVREGDKTCKTGTVAKNRPFALQGASDWELSVDLKRKLVLLSRNSKTIIVAELTVPWEERLATSHKLKKAKYQYLVVEAVFK